MGSASNVPVRAEAGAPGPGLSTVTHNQDTVLVGTRRASGATGRFWKLFTTLCRRQGREKNVYTRVSRAVASRHSV